VEDRANRKSYVYLSRHRLLSPKMREGQPGDSIQREAAFGLHNLGSDGRFRGGNGEKVAMCALCALCVGVSIMFFQNGRPPNATTIGDLARTLRALRTAATALLPLPSHRHLSPTHSLLVEKGANRKSYVYLSRHRLLLLEMGEG
jgi:hypothetical protein